MFDRRLFLLLLSVSVLGAVGDVSARGGGAPAQGSVSGRLKELNLSVAPPTVTIADTTLKVTSTTVIEIGGERATVFDLEIDEFTVAHFAAPSGVATKIEQNGRDEDEDAAVTGRVTAADPEAGTVALDVDQDEVADLTVTVDAGTEIEIGSVRLSASQIGLLNGLDATVEYSTVTLIAREINATAGTQTNLTGRVTAVNSIERTIGIDTGDGVALVNVPKGATIKSKGKKVRLESIREGAKVVAKTVTNGSGDLIAVKLTVTGRRKR